MSSLLDDSRQQLLVVDVDGESESDDIQRRYDHPKFQIRNLTKVSDAGVPILKGINLDVPNGVILGVIGPSGSGKSTFLRALNRLWEPPSRTVFFEDSDICDLDVLSLRRKVGMLFQLPALFEGTVADNVRYGPQLRGKKLTDDEVCKLLITADLDASFMNKKGAELSVGQAQRVALARTLANSPEVCATVAETGQPKWWEKNAPNMIDIHSTQEFLDSLSQAGDRLVIVEFYGTWCASCRALYPKLCRTAEDHPEIIFLKVNFDENKPMCKSMNVKVLPYFHFYRGADGQLESFSCSLAKFQKIKDAIEMHNTARCSIGPPKGIGDLKIEPSFTPKDISAESTKE